jgi:hypothetical protein
MTFKITVQNDLLPRVQNQSISLSPNYSSSKKAAIFKVMGLVTIVALPILFAFAGLYKLIPLACFAGLLLITYSFALSRLNDLNNTKAEYAFARTLSKEEAKSWLQKSAEKGYLPAMCDYGINYDNEEMLRRADSAGDAKASVYLKDLQIFKKKLSSFKYEFELSLAVINSSRVGDEFADLEKFAQRHAAGKVAPGFVKCVGEILNYFNQSENYSLFKDRLKEPIGELIQKYLGTKFLTFPTFLDLVIENAKKSDTQTSRATLELLEDVKLKLQER